MPGRTVAVGRVGRPHGLDGSFFVEDPSEDGARYAVGAELLVDGETAKIIASKRGAGARPVIRLDRAARRGARLEVAVDALVEPAGDGFYVFQLVGLEVVEAGGRPLGRVEEVEPGVANDVLELDSGLALPMHEECIREIDLGAGRITVAPGFADPL